MTKASSGPLVGRRLAEAAHLICREVDEERHGLPVAEIESALKAKEIDVGGGDQRSTLSTALNKHQDLFARVGPATWAWTPQSFDPTKGLSGAALAEEAYLVLSKHDPNRQGLHYELIKKLLRESGVQIRGGNPGDTVFTALQNASQWFEWVGSGVFRLK